MVAPLQKSIRWVMICVAVAVVGCGTTTGNPTLPGNPFDTSGDEGIPFKALLTTFTAEDKCFTFEHRETWSVIPEAQFFQIQDDQHVIKVRLEGFILVDPQLIDTPEELQAFAENARPEVGGFDPFINNAGTLGVTSDTSTGDFFVSLAVANTVVSLLITHNKDDATEAILVDFIIDTFAALPGCFITSSF